MFFERHGGGEKTLLVHIDLDKNTHFSDQQEFSDLALSAGALTLAFVQVTRLEKNSKTLLGSGKIEDIRHQVISLDIELVIFNHPLTPTQERNLEKILKCRVIDRTGLILDIFSQRARTYEGKLQVELAQLKHISTRLVRGWTHLERQKGGIGLRGPGETQLETDRRLLRIRMQQLKMRLEKVRQQRQQARRSRERASIPIVSLVGYTNAGKSTLFNTLTSASAYAADQLFATLDPTLRVVMVPGFGKVVFADTVGFIKDLPHDLVDAFRATLEETVQADLLLHVIDVSSEDKLNQCEQVYQVLQDIGAQDSSVIEVMNKIDQLKVFPAQPLETALPYHSDVQTQTHERIWVSAKKQLGIDGLLRAIARQLATDVFEGEIKLPQDMASIRAQLFSLKTVCVENFDDKGQSFLQIRLPKSQLERILGQAGKTIAEVLA